MIGHSVIVPMRNAAPFVGACLRSVLEQLQPEDEILVVDNGSTDSSVEIVHGLGEPSVHLLAASTPGPSAARNVGLRHARGKYVTFLDADDMWAAERLTLMQSAIAATPGANAAYGRVKIQYEAGIPQLHGDVDGQFVQNWAIWTYMFERSLVEKVGPFAEELQMGEDTDFILRARRAGMTCAVCDAVVSVYRRHAGNVTNDRPEVKRSFMRTLARNAARLRAERNGNA